MEAKELMIGDWVQGFIEDTNAQVMEIGWTGAVRIITQNGIEILLNEDDIQPIPLTPEILEKNRFERRGGISCHKSNIGLIIHHWNDDLCFLNYSKKNIPPIMIPFHYVHELQHALRLCGLNELADSFKV